MSKFDDLIKKQGITYDVPHKKRRIIGVVITTKYENKEFRVAHAFKEPTEAFFTTFAKDIAKDQSKLTKLEEGDVPVDMMDRMLEMYDELIVDIAGYVDDNGTAVTAEMYPDFREYPSTMDKFRAIVKMMGEFKLDEDLVKNLKTPSGQPGRRDETKPNALKTTANTSKEMDRQPAKIARAMPSRPKHPTPTSSGS